jgi:ribosomal protein S18 acetylase RimI-like enzyme
MIQMHIRQASTEDYPRIEELVIESFEPVTLARPLDEKFGPLNGLDWRERWRLRLQKAFMDQVVLVGEMDGTLAAVSTTALDRAAALAYLDTLAVDVNQQHHGYGREMLRATIQHVRGLGMRYMHLDCLTTNENANKLYKSEGFEEVACHIRWFRAL